MPTSKKPRKKYQARPAGADFIKAFRFNSEADFWLKNQPHQALESMRTGTATANDLDAVSLRVLWGAQMAEDHIVEAEPKAIMRQGIAALDSVAARYDRIGRVGLAGEELRQLGEAITLTDDLQSTLTRREMEQSLKIVLGKRNQQIGAQA